MDAPILLKAQIKGYAKRDGTFVAAHSDKRPGAKDAYKSKAEPMDNPPGYAPLKLRGKTQHIMAFDNRCALALEANKAAVAATKKAQASNSVDDHRVAAAAHRKASALLHGICQEMATDQQIQNEYSADDYVEYSGAIEGHAHDARYHESKLPAPPAVAKLIEALVPDADSRASEVKYTGYTADMQMRSGGSRELSTMDVMGDQGWKFDADFQNATHPEGHSASFGEGRGLVIRYAKGYKG